MFGSQFVGFKLGRSSCLALGLVLVGCAQLPPSMVGIGWADLWGDRGEGVLARDYQMCSDLIEQRRSLLVGCMAYRGWQIKGD